MTRAGVYAIVCEPTGEVYVGASSWLSNRRTSHFSQLRNGCHNCRRLQERYQTHGGDAFSWVVLEAVDADDGLEMARLLEKAEQKWFGRFASSSIFNESRSKFPSRPGTGDVRVPVKISPTLLVRLRSRAKAERRSLAMVLNDAVRCYLADVRKTDR